MYLFLSKLFFNCKLLSGHKHMRKSSLQNALKISEQDKSQLFSKVVEKVLLLMYEQRGRNSFLWQALMLTRCCSKVFQSWKKTFQRLEAATWMRNLNTHMHKQTGMHEHMHANLDSGHSKTFLPCERACFSLGLELFGYWTGTLNSQVNCCATYFNGNINRIDEPTRRSFLINNISFAYYQMSLFSDFQIWNKKYIL